MLKRTIYEQATDHMPGGVSSPVRAFGGVGGTPFFAHHGAGPFLYDTNGKKYIDYVCSWGPLISGHAHPAIVQAITETVQNGLTFGAPTELELVLAQKIKQHLPSIDLLRFVNSGTEAAMSAIRLARGFTRKNKIIKFAGCYHGHADSLLVSAGSGALTFGVPSSAGVPAEITQHTLVAPFNDLAQVETLFAANRHEIAAVIVEPIAGNMNLVRPQEGFLQGLKQLCEQHDSLLIFDEVITGFRVGLGGAQAYFDIKPDLTILGKIIGGGMPAAVYGGREDIMKLVAPLGPVYQAGTLSGNPLAMAAGIAQLNLLEQTNFYIDLENNAKQLINGLQAIANQHQIPLLTDSIGGMFGLFFTTQTLISNEDDVKRCNINLFKRFFHAMLTEGVYFAPSAFEIGFISSAHATPIIDQTLLIAEKVFSHLKD